MRVFHAYTADGHQFDACCATDANLARLVVARRYADKAAMHFVGDQPRTGQSLTDGMKIVEMLDIRVADQFALDALAEEYAAADASRQGETAARLDAAITAIIERRGRLRNAERNAEADAAMSAAMFDAQMTRK